MKNRKLLLIVSLVLALTMSLGGTLAYLTDTDSDVNVMTLGNVDITQLENGVDGPIDIDPLYPAYWEGDWQTVEVTGAIDKVVTVKNTGSSDAYVRTVFAFEAGTLNYDDFMKYIHADFAQTVDGWVKTPVTITDSNGDSGKYYIAWYTYPTAIEKGKESSASLERVIMDKDADNEIVEMFGKDYRVYVVSQAVQTKNLESLTPSEALNMSFYEISATNHPWTEENFEQPSTPDLIIDTVEELVAFAEDVNSGNRYEGKTVALGANLDLAGVDWKPIGNVESYPGITFAGTFDGNNHTISNLTTSDNTKSWASAGLFGSITGKVQNLTLKNVDITSTHYAGGIVGFSSANNGMKIENCHVIGGTITSAAELIDGSYDNGDKVGGIIGYCVAGDKIVNCSVSNVTLKAYRDIGGIAGYAQASCIQNCTVSGINIEQDFTHDYKGEEVNEGDRVGQIIGYDGSKSYDSLEGSAVSVNVSTADDLVANLNAGTAVVQTTDLTVDADNSAAQNSYGDTGVTVKDTIYDGNGNTLTVTNSYETWDCGIFTTGGTIKNLTVNESFRGIFMGGSLTSDLYIDNVIIDKVCYAFNTDGTPAQANEYKVVITNSTLNGWTSYSENVSMVEFTNCNFGKGTGGYQYAFCRPYAPTVLTNCTFSEDFEFDARKNNEIVFINCYVGTTQITADNIVDLLGANAANAIVK